MKKNHLLSFGLLAAGLLGLAGCNGFEIPQSVSVKTGAEYNVPLGTADLSGYVKQYLNKDTILDTMRSTLGETANVYEYIQDGAGKSDILSYMVRYPLYKVDFNVGSMLSNLNIADALNGIGGGGALVDQSVTIPTISFEQSFDIPVADIVNATTSSMSAGLAGATFNLDPALEPGSVGGAVDIDSMLGGAGATVSCDYADAIKYKDGSKLLIKAEKLDSTPCSPDFTFELKGTIAPAAGFSGTDSGFVDIKNGGTVEIDIGSTKGNLPASFTINLAANYEGGTLGTEHKYRFTFSFADGTEVEAIYGLNPEGNPGDSSDDIEIPEFNIEGFEFPVSSMASMLSSATIGEGGLKIYAAKPNVNWSGISFNIDNFSLKGAGLNKTKSDFVDKGGSFLINEEMNLAGSTITLDPAVADEKITVDGKITINLNGANIDLTGVTGVTAKVEFGIQKLSSATINLAGMGLDSIEPIKTELPAELKQYVKKINFGTKIGGVGKKHSNSGVGMPDVACDGFGIKAEIINTFPAGSDITFGIKSTFFNLTGSDVIAVNIPGGTTDLTEKKWNAWPEVNLATLPAEADGKYYADVEFDFPGTITVNNLVMGESYSLKIANVKPLIDFDYVEADMTSQSMKGSMDLSSFDLGGMLSGFLGDDADKINLVDLPVFFFASKPEDAALNTLLGNITFGGTLDINEYGKDGEGNVDTSSPINFVNILSGSLSLDKPAVAWPDADVNVIDATKAEFSGFTRANLSAAAAFPVVESLVDVINDKPAGISIDYDLSLQGTGGTNIKIYSGDLASVSPETNLAIQLELAAILPLQLKLTDAINFTVMEAQDDGAGNYTDILGRTDPNQYAEYADYATSVKYIKLSYSLNNKLLTGFKATVIVEDKAGSGVSIPPIEFVSGKREIKLSGSDIKKILTHTFSPSVAIRIGEEGKESDITISRSAFNTDGGTLSATMGVSVKVDDNSPITIWKAE